MSIHDFSNVADERRGFHCAPDIKHIRLRTPRVMILGPSAGRSSRRSKECFNCLLMSPITRVRFVRRV